ncbi:MAG: gas vesicle protein [Chloroflexi bacterium]|nr:gas vesicle protein [Chloroflexota bacterium]
MNDRSKLNDDSVREGQNPKVKRKTIRASGINIAQCAKEELGHLTGLKPDTVSGLSQDQDGWHVIVEIVEMKRIPEATDVLASYEVLLDDEGNLISYQRTRRYFRDQITEKV